MLVNMSIRRFAPMALIGVVPCGLGRDALINQGEGGA